MAVIVCICFELYQLGQKMLDHLISFNFGTFGDNNSGTQQSEADLLNKRSSLAQALGVTKSPKVSAMFMVPLCCAT
jgi:hypothetical protein